MKTSPFITIAIGGCLTMVFCTVAMAEVSQTSGHRKSKQPRPVPETNAAVPKKAKLTTLDAKRIEGAPDSHMRQAKADSPEASKPGKTVRHGKKSKKAKPHAVAEPRKDLTYHGILEGPSRYEPRRDYPTAGPPDPQTSELTYEHFQELDRNGDGSIDPVERAFGRLDMDHDLSKRQR